MSTGSVTSPSLQTTRRWSARRLGTWVLGALLVLLLLFQLVPYGRNHTNPPVVAEPQWDSPQTRTLFMRSCGDCHSNETVWPWYSNLAPVSWLTARDVFEGREKLNISAWGQQRNETDEIVKQVRDGEMPPWFYLPLHPAAKLSATEQEQLIAGLTATFGGQSESGGAERDNDND